MKGRRIFSIIGMLLIISFLTACGSKGMQRDASTSTTRENTAADIATDEDMAFNSTAKGEAANPEEAPKSDSDSGIADATAFTSEKVQSQDKIIQYFYLDVETQDFEKLINNINTKISSLGGYVESSQIGGKSYYDNNVTRNGNIVARIPSNKADEFVTDINTESNVTSSRKTSENVSLQYIEVQSRIEALEIEQDRLFAILEKSDNLENIITLESRLSDIRYELQNYKSQLRAYDNKVEYSTVSLNVNEVNRITPVTEEKQTLGSRIKNGFSDTVYNIGEGVQNFLVWFIVNLPYLLIWGILLFVIVIIIRKYLRNDKAKRNASAFSANNNQSGQMNNQTMNQQLDQGQHNKDQH